MDPFVLLSTHAPISFIILWTLWIPQDIVDYEFEMWGGHVGIHHFAHFESELITYNTEGWLGKCIGTLQQTRTGLNVG